MGNLVPPSVTHLQQIMAALVVLNPHIKFSIFSFSIVFVYILVYTICLECILFPSYLVEIISDAARKNGIPQTLFDIKHLFKTGRFC